MFSSQAAAAGGHLGLAWEPRGSDLVLLQAGAGTVPGAGAEAGPGAVTEAEAEVVGYEGWKARLNLGFINKRNDIHLISSPDIRNI